MDKLLDFYEKPPKMRIIKYREYLDVYAKHFSRFLGKNPTILEIGIYGGGYLKI